MQAQGLCVRAERDFLEQEGEGFFRAGDKPKVQFRVGRGERVFIVIAIIFDRLRPFRGNDHVLLPRLIHDSDEGVLLPLTESAIELLLDPPSDGRPQNERSVLCLVSLIQFSKQNKYNKDFPLTWPVFSRSPKIP